MSAAFALRRPARHALGWLPFIIFAGVLGFAAVGHPKVAVATIALPAVIWLIVNPGWAVVAAVALLPLQRDIVGHEGGSIEVAASDALLLVAVIGLLPLVLMSDQIRPRVKAITPAFVVVGVYFAWLAVVDVIHFSSGSVANTIQYAELSLVAMLLGALLLTERMLRWALVALVLVASVTAVIWITKHGISFADNKNPAGQFMVDGALVALVVIRQWWIKFPLIALLVTGLLYTESRGALLGGLAGAVVLFLFKGLGSWQKTVAVTVGAVVVVLGVYHFAPGSLRHRVQTIENSAHIPEVLAEQNVVDASLPGGLYSAQIRDIYRREGIALARQHEIDGVGVGNYATGNVALGTATNNPHDVLILNAVEGGVPDLVLFVGIIGATAFLIWRKRDVTHWAGLAISIQVGIFVHGLLDIYWVRGTPDIGWILVGAALVPTALMEPTMDGDAAA